MGGDGSDEAIAHARHGLNKQRGLGVIAEGEAYFANGCIDAVFRVDEDFAVPEFFGDFSASDEATVGFDEKQKQLHRLAFDLQGAAFAEEFEAAGIEPKVAKFEDRKGHESGLCA